MPHELQALDHWPLMAKKQNELKKIIADNLAGQQVSPFTFERYTVPTGGATMWTVETPDGASLVDEIEGVILDVYDTRGYYIGNEDGDGGALGNAPPDCSSPDCIVGRGRISEDDTEDTVRDCASCSKSQWGSGRNGRGQACGVKKRMFLMTEDAIMPIPVALFLPSASLIAMQKYLLGLLRFGLEPHCVLTKFTLEKDRNADGQEYARVIPKNGGRLNEDAMKKFGAIANALRPVLRSAKIEDHELQQESGE
jgi:hypothetical protein